MSGMHYNPADFERARARGQFGASGLTGETTLVAGEGELEESRVIVITEVVAGVSGPVRASIDIVSLEGRSFRRTVGNGRTEYLHPIIAQRVVLGAGIQEYAGFVVG